MEAFSRRVFQRPSHATPRLTCASRSVSDLRQMKSEVGPIRIQIRLCKQAKKKGNGTPRDAYFQPPRFAARRASSGTRRLSAFHRGTCCSEPTPQLSSRRASWDVV